LEADSALRCQRLEQRQAIPHDGGEVELGPLQRFAPLVLSMSTKNSSRCLPRAAQTR
jgi:hypothetical protein